MKFLFLCILFFLIRKQGGYRSIWFSLVGIDVFFSGDGKEAEKGIDNGLIVYIMIYKDLLTNIPR